MSNFVQSFYLACLLFFVPFIYAQENNPPELPSVIGPTPEAASLAKFGEIPVDYANGLYNLSVPIHSIKTPYLSIPISLNYHSLGVIVGETASTAGVNWALSAGGSITRQIRGNPDDIAHGYLGFGKGAVYYDFFTNHNKRTSVWNGEESYGYDLFPDKFSINLPTISGTFIYDHETKEPRLKSLQNVEIETSQESISGEISGFEVVDENGIKYILDRGSKRVDFKTIILTNSQPTELAPSSNYNRYSSWVLTQIVLPNGDLINFSYINGNYRVMNIAKDEIENPNTDFNINNVPLNAPAVQNIVKTISETTMYEKYISEITHNNTQIQFNYSEGREDIQPNGNYSAKKLTDIKVFDITNNIHPTNDSVPKLNKHFKLVTSYFGATQQSISNLNSYFMSQILLDSSSNKRLRLDKVINLNPTINQNSTSNDSLIYKFNYNSDEIANRFTTAQDYWGYYNGADNGNNLAFGLNKDRRVNDVYGKKGLIESVEYPNGLIKSFEYERQGGYLSTKLQDVGTELLNSVTNRNVFFSTLHISTSDEYNITGSSIWEYPFEVGNDGINFSFKAYVSSFYPGANNPCDYTFSIINTDDVDSNDNPLVPFSHNVSNATQGETGSINFSNMNNLSPGNYKLRVQAFHGGTYDPQFFIGFHFGIMWEEGNFEQNYIQGPGYRIKKIESEDLNNSNNLAVEEFKYIRENGNDSGIVYGLPNYFVKNSSFGNNISFNAIEGNYTNSVFENYQGNQNSYSRVVIREGNKGIAPNEEVYFFNGERELIYSIYEDGNSFLSYPFVLPDSNNWHNGKLLKERTYAYNTNGNNKLLSEKLFEYSVDYPNLKLELNSNILLHLIEYKDEKEGNNINVNYQGNITENGTYPAYPSSHNSGNIWRIPLSVIYLENTIGGLAVKYKVYYLTGGFLKLNSVKTKNYFYDDDGLSGVIEKDTYNDYYNEDFIFNKKSVLSEDYNNGSLTQTTKQQFFYPSDDIALPSWYPSNWDTQALFNANRIGSPVAVETYRNDVLTSKLGYKYESITSSPSNLLEIKEAHFAKGNQVLEPKVIYDLYDDRGNVLQVRKADGTPITYLYGYHQTKPIAKLVNLEYSQLSDSVLQNLQNLSNADNDHCQGDTGCNEAALRAVLNGLRDTFTEAQISTYTYDPLVGVTSETDPSGRTMYYQYDHFNRLEKIVDEYGNILEEYEYNYRGNN